MVTVVEPIPVIVVPEGIPVPDCTTIPTLKADGFPTPITLEFLTRVVV
jgi:hypothetical protein